RLRALAKLELPPGAPRLVITPADHRNARVWLAAVELVPATWPASLTPTGLAKPLPSEPTSVTVYRTGWPRAGAAARARAAATRAPRSRAIMDVSLAGPPRGWAAAPASLWESGTHRQGAMVSDATWRP